MTAYLKFKGYIFNISYIFDRSKEWKCNCGTWHCLLVPENSSKQHSTLNPLTNLYKTKLSCSTIVLACSTKLWTWHSSMCFILAEYLQPNESVFGCCKLTFFKMLFLHANLTVKKVCELLLSPIHQVKGFFCGYEVIPLEKEFPVPVTWEIRWVPELIWMHRRRDKSSGCAGNPQFHRHTACTLVTSLQL